MTKASGGHRLTRQTLRGTWAPVLLPLTPDEAIDFGLLRDELAVLTGAGLDGIYTNGTASEFHCLEEDEYDRITDIVAQACRQAGVACQLGASQMSGQASLRRIRVAAACDPAAIQVILPDWCPLSADEVLASIDRMAREAGGGPLVLYHPPPCSAASRPSSPRSSGSRWPGATRRGTGRCATWRAIWLSSWLVTTSRAGSGRARAVPTPTWPA